MGALRLTDQEYFLFTPSTFNGIRTHKTMKRSSFGPTRQTRIPPLLYTYRSRQRISHQEDRNHRQPPPRARPEAQRSYQPHGRWTGMRSPRKCNEHLPARQLRVTRRTTSGSTAQLRRRAYWRITGRTTSLVGESKCFLVPRQEIRNQRCRERERQAHKSRSYYYKSSNSGKSLGEVACQNRVAYWRWLPKWRIPQICTSSSYQVLKRLRSCQVR
jgi:hypothetical protein